VRILRSTRARRCQTMASFTVPGEEMTQINKLQVFWRRDD
jgi:hypothetical protein